MTFVSVDILHIATFATFIYLWMEPTKSKWKNLKSPQAVPQVISVLVTLVAVVPVHFNPHKRVILHLQTFHWKTALSLKMNIGEDLKDQYCAHESYMGRINIVSTWDFQLFRMIWT